MTMPFTLKTMRDRAGHAAAVLLLFAAIASAGPGDYKARRFDVLARAANGDLDVTESITFEFQSGTFTKVWRDIPASRTDGIEVLDASIDGKTLTQGDGPGQFEVSGGNRTRVEWHFPETGASVHRFDLHYLARGALYREGRADAVRWRALPSEHRYRIDASRIQFEPASIVLPPEARRVGSMRVNASSEGVTIDASNIAPDGWIIAELHYPAGEVTAPSDPQWRQRDVRARELGPRWALAAVLTFAGALFLILIVRQGYDSPENVDRETTATAPPQVLPAALVSVLTARGGPSGYQAIGTLLDLADRRVLEIREERRAF